MKNKILLLPLLLFVVSCSNDDKKAAEMYNQAEQYYQTGEYTVAAQWLDSIEKSYPKAFDVIRQGMVLHCRINQKVYEQELIHIDSLYNLAQNELTQLKPQFNLVREGEYQTLGNYVHKKQRTSGSVSKSEIKAQVTEKGDFQLVSIYHGNGKINHTGIKVVQPDGSYSESAAIAYDGAKNYRFTDGGTTTETITYNIKQCKSVADMIALSESKKLTVKYTGGKNYTIMLDPNVKQIIAETYRLSQVMALSDSLSMRRQYGIKQLELADAQLMKLEDLQNTK